MVNNGLSASARAAAALPPVLSSALSKPVKQPSAPLVNTKSEPTLLTSAAPESFALPAQSQNAQSAQSTSVQLANATRISSALQLMLSVVATSTLASATRTSAS